MGPYRILLDCGLADSQLLESKKVPVDAVFCSHAHADHARGLLAFHAAFPSVPIYASEVTLKLLPLNWLDVPVTLEDFCQALPWRTPIPLGENLSAAIYPSGHLPGAAAICLSYRTPERTYRLFYTGDFSLSNFQLVEGLSVELLRGLAPDILIVEGSYGTARHPHRRQQEKQLMTRIYRAITEGQSVFLPVPALGLGQEILKLLRSHHQFTGKDVDIWVHGKVALACDLYLNLMSDFPLSVQNFAKHQPLFWDERICPRLGRLTALELAQLGDKPCIILSDQPELLESALQKLPLAWLLLVPELTHAVPQLPQLPNLATETYLLAEHSDSRNTIQLIHNLRPQHIIFVHGSANYLADLTSLEELQNRYQLHSPSVGTLVELPIGDRFLQPSPVSPSHYEGELNESSTAVTITLPDNITGDPRWGAFADTGLVEARWQGEELLLKGVSQRELLRDNVSSPKTTAIDCCRTCRHQKSQRCWNPESPLYGFKVIAEGYCPVFEPLNGD
jgi:Cft2 family RNA processing exonuclease